MSNFNSYTLSHILLIESNFSRSWIINFENPEFSNNIDIDVSDSRNEESLNVTVSLVYSAGVGEVNEIYAAIKMIGVFSLPKESAIPIGQFAKVNAPAIIFPFIREHLASLSVKANINPILLQPVNFVKRSKVDNNPIPEP
jgi:preprotein translocase subunit SecB